MEIIISQEQARVPVTVIHPVGRINLGNADELEKKFREVFGKGALDFVLDLKEVPSLTSAGLRVVNIIYRLANSDHQDDKTKSTHLKLCNLDEDVRKVFNIAGFDLFLEIYDSLQEALKTF